MTDAPARFVWYELMTTDTEAARQFYEKVVGWNSQDAAVPGVSYTLFTAASGPVAGLMTMPDEACQQGAPPLWIGYIGVSDVDAMAKRIAQRGGAAYVAPTDIPGVGRFAVHADPQAATFSIFKGANPEQDAAPDCQLPGHIGWHELLAADWPAAFDFYSGLFGWQKADAIDIGEMGKYQLFSADGAVLGGMFNKPPAVPRPFWLFYFNVEDIDAASARVSAAGGQIVNGPMEVPGGAWIIQGRDPQGAMFALVGKRVAAATS
jgi:predicted enzyme related to lactoylglutathione lyase